MPIIVLDDGAIATAVQRTWPCGADKVLELIGTTTLVTRSRPHEGPGSPAWPAWPAALAVLRLRADGCDRDGRRAHDMLARRRRLPAMPLEALVT